ncbi:MAG: hypothetical protein MUQ32_12505 [Chloroflexi bacterium]|nr:hypothetical protein [Chloroflexota bacterium]
MTHREDARDNAGWAPLIAISMVMFIVALDATMLNVAIPDIVKDLGTSTSAVQSAVALYSLTMAALMVGARRVVVLIFFASTFLRRRGPTTLDPPAA